MFAKQSFIRRTSRCIYKGALNLCKRALNLCKRALCICKRALDIRKNRSCSVEKLEGDHTTGTFTCPQTGPTCLQKTPTHLQKSPTYRQKSVTHLQQSPTHLQKKKLIKKPEASKLLLRPLYRNRSLLQKRPMILSSLLIVATTYQFQESWVLKTDTSTNPQKNIVNPWKIPIYLQKSQTHM